MPMKMAGWWSAAIADPQRRELRRSGAGDPPSRRSFCRQAAAAKVGAMIQTPPDLDVVVLGGGGHVGLPLSLVFAKAGLRVGIYDTNQATLDRIAAGEMPFLETGADELLRDVLSTRRLELGT